MEAETIVAPAHQFLPQHVQQGHCLTEKSHVTVRVFLVFCYHCDFQQGTCGGENDSGNNVGCGWNLRKGFAATPDSGPFADRTYGTLNVTYLYFQSSYCRQKDNDGFVGVNLPIQGFTQKSICVKFWYHMYGNGDEYELALALRESKTVRPLPGIQALERQICGCKIKTA